MKSFDKIMNVAAVLVLLYFYAPLAWDAIFSEKLQSPWPIRILCCLALLVPAVLAPFVMEAAARLGVALLNALHDFIDRNQ